MRTTIARLALPILAAAVLSDTAAADELLYAYEGDVLPYDESAGWLIANPCEPPCSESVVDGRYVLKWPIVGDLAFFAYRIAKPGSGVPPPSLWVEWRFWSNHPIGRNFTSCDGTFDVDYRSLVDAADFYGDAVVSYEGSDYVLGLDIDLFHTYRFESPDGDRYCFWVDGIKIWCSRGRQQDDGGHSIKFGSSGGCNSDWVPDAVNKWDYVRYGTIASDERIIASDPPQGLLDIACHARLDRFAVSFDAPNYVYVEDITVEVTGGDTPVVTDVRRRDDDGLHTVQIVLDRPIPMGETTRFTIGDSWTDAPPAPNPDREGGRKTDDAPRNPTTTAAPSSRIIEYALAPGGPMDLRNVATLQNCFGEHIDISPGPPFDPKFNFRCQPLDLNHDAAITLPDLPLFTRHYLAGPEW